MQFVSDKNIIDAWDGDIPKLLDILENGFLQWRAGEILQPEKSSQILNAADQTRAAQPGETALLIHFAHEKEYIQKEDTR